MIIRWTGCLIVQDARHAAGVVFPMDNQKYYNRKDISGDFVHTIQSMSNHSIDERIS